MLEEGKQLCNMLKLLLQATKKVGGSLQVANSSI